MQLAEEGVEAVAVCFLHAYANPDHEGRAAAIASEASCRTPRSPPPTRWRRRCASTSAPRRRSPTPTSSSWPGAISTTSRKACATSECRRRCTSPSPTAAPRPRPPRRSSRCGWSNPAPAAAPWRPRRRRGAAASRTCSPSTWGAPRPRPSSRPVESSRSPPSRRSPGYTASNGEAGLPLLVPVLDMIEVGGPAAAASPASTRSACRWSDRKAPAPLRGRPCYGLGGELPTVTDADLLLGFLNPGFFLGGEMALDTRGRGPGGLRFRPRAEPRPRRGPRGLRPNRIPPRPPGGFTGW